MHRCPSELQQLMHDQSDFSGMPMISYYVAIHIYSIYHYHYLLMIINHNFNGSHVKTLCE